MVNNQKITPYVKWQFRDDKSRWEEGAQFIISTRYPRAMRAIECYLELHPHEFMIKGARYIEGKICIMRTHRSESQYRNACQPDSVDQTRRSANWWMARYKDIFDFALKQGAVVTAEGVGWPVARAGDEYYRCPRKDIMAPVSFATDKEHL